VARVAVAGQDNSALKIESTGPAPAASAIPKDGIVAYETPAGLSMAPALRVRRRWETRPHGARESRRARRTLYKHALGGFNGKSGVMPPKGGRADWPDDSSSRPSITSSS
jgi:cytochrome c5